MKAFAILPSPMILKFHKALVTLSLMLIILSCSSEEATIGAGHVSVNREAFLRAETSEKADMLCAGCHGKDGNGDRFFGAEAMWGTPMIRGLNEQYIFEQLQKYKFGNRAQAGSNPGEMNKLMQDPAMRESIIRELSAYYANFKKLNADKNILDQFNAAEKRAYLLGEKIFKSTCATCHGEQGMGLPGSTIPHLAGQIAIYTKERILFFTHETTSGSSSVMGDALKPISLNDDQIEGLTFYLESIVGKR